MGRRSSTKSGLTSGIYAAAAIAAALSWGADTARADDDGPSASAQPDVSDGLDEFGEVIVVWGERAEKPLDRDTELRLTGAELARRGATTLADALDLLPDLQVRAAGRGGRQVNIRGGRKGSIKILIDGVEIADPHYGTIDISAIPVTDIEQIRVSTSPASPIDGPGGPAGVIEIHTRDAVGKRLLITRMTGSTLPDGDLSVTGRTAITDTIAARASAKFALGLRDYALTMPTAINVPEDRSLSTASTRLEYRQGSRRVALDTSLLHTGFVVAPREDGGGSFLVIDGETRGRAALSASADVGLWQLSSDAYLQLLTRDSVYYDDPELTADGRAEDLSANRAGAGALVNRPLGRHVQWIAALRFDTEAADVSGFDGANVSGRASTLTVANGAQYERGRFDIDGAVGVSVPFGIDANPWLEGKLVGKARVAGPLSVEGIISRKGRTPTLRERFRVDGGNATLGPEHATHAELAVAITPRSGVQFRVAPYVRDSTGIIRRDGPMLVNTGELTIRGVDARARLGGDALGASVTYALTDAFSRELGADPLDFLPRHRAELSVRAARVIGNNGFLRRVGGTVRLRYQSEQIDQAMTLPARTTAHATAFAATDNLQLSIRADDIGGATYEIRNGVLSAGRVFTFTLASHWQ